MVSLVFRQKAIEDLNYIWNYTRDKWSVEQADKYYTAIKLACIEIKENPKIGRKFNQITNNLLGYNSGRHIIFYQSISNDRIEIVRILHERMDLNNRIGENKS